MKKIFFGFLSGLFDVNFLAAIMCFACYIFTSKIEWRYLHEGLTLICFWPLYIISCKLKTENQTARNLLSKIYDWSHYKDSPYMKEVSTFLENS